MRYIHDLGTKKKSFFFAGHFSKDFLKISYILFPLPCSMENLKEMKNYLGFALAVSQLWSCLLFQEFYLEVSDMHYEVLCLTWEGKGFESLTLAILQSVNSILNLNGC